MIANQSTTLASLVQDCLVKPVLTPAGPSISPCWFKSAPVRYG